MNEYVQVYVVVEGQTEQSFIREILAPHLAYTKVLLYPVLIGKPGHKGGSVSLQRTLTDIGNFLKQRPDTIITTMLDYYGLRGEWPGRILADPKRYIFSPAQKAREVEDGLLLRVANENPTVDVQNRFIPFFVMHEFEGLLFSDPATLAQKLDLAESSIWGILEECGEPEAINEQVETAPSKRLDALIAGKYRKTTQGIAIACSIGLPRIRQECPHFDSWIRRLEGLR